MKVCTDCTDAQEPLRTPTHPVHPEHGAMMVFDIYGSAVGPSCAAVWFRHHKGIVLMERKPPKRATALPVKGQEPAKRVTGRR